MCLVGEIVDPYYQKRNFGSLFNRPKRSCLFQHLQAGENLRKNLNLPFYESRSPRISQMRRPKKILFDLIYKNHRSRKGYWGLSNCLLEIWPGIRPLRRIQKKRSPIIQRISQFLVGDSGVLDGVGRIRVTELPLNRCDIAGSINQGKGFLLTLCQHNIIVVLRLCHDTKIFI